MLGEKVGRYRITRKVGAGQMGEVFLAEHEELDARAAVKVLARPWTRDERIARRFLIEAKAASRVSHPGVVKMLDVGRLSSGDLFVMMEFLDGESLARRLAGGRRLSPATAIAFVRQAARALRAVHEYGVVHRDIRPKNMFLVPDPEVAGGERVVLLDLGIAKLVGDGEAAPGVYLSVVSRATLAYMSPEQCRGAGGVSPKADLYALGVVLFQMVCGELPFRERALGDWIVAHVTEPAPDARKVNPDVPVPLAAVIAGLLSKIPDARPTADELVEALRGIDTAASADDPPRLSAMDSIEALVGRAALPNVAPDEIAASVRARYGSESARLFEVAFHVALAMTGDRRDAFLAALGLAPGLHVELIEMLSRVADEGASVLGGAEGDRGREWAEARLEVPTDVPTLVRGDRVADRYDILASLGRGGMGSVYAARDRKLGRRVALKLLRRHDEQFVSRFLAEARATARCEHENIVSIYDIDEYRPHPDSHVGYPYLVLEHLDGDNLRRQLVESNTSGGQQVSEHALDVIISVVRALACAHQSGIVHRDLKPENIFITRAGHVKVLDFGIAKILGEDGVTDAERATDMTVLAAPNPTRAGAVMGTLPYMSPEQWGVGEVDARTDIWAVGVILFEMLVGRYPIECTSMQELRAAVCNLDAPVVGIRESVVEAVGTYRTSNDLAIAIDRCLRKSKAERYESANALLADFVRIHERMRGTARAVSRDNSARPVPPEVDGLYLPFVDQLPPRDDLFLLLHWRYRLVPRLFGRDDDLAELLDWAQDGQGGARLRWLHGPGGVGKSRLGAELCARLHDRGWAAGFADLAEPCSLPSSLSEGLGVCVLLDYPEERRGETLAWLKQLARKRPSYPVRVLLLSRRDLDDDWTADLQREDAWDLCDVQSIRSLPALGEGDVLGLAESAISRLAAQRDEPPPPLDPDRVCAWLANDPATHGLPLFVTAAAIHAVLDPGRAFGLRGGDIVEALVAREVRRLDKIGVAVGLGERGASRLCGLAVLRGVLDSKTLKRLAEPTLGLGPCAPHEIVEAAARLPHWRDGAVHAPVPDLVAAALLQRVLDRCKDSDLVADWLWHCFDGCTESIIERLGRVCFDIEIIGARASRPRSGRLLRHRLADMIGTEIERAQALAFVSDQASRPLPFPLTSLALAVALALEGESRRNANAEPAEWQPELANRLNNLAVMTV